MDQWNPTTDLERRLQAQSTAIQQLHAAINALMAIIAHMPGANDIDINSVKSIVEELSATGDYDQYGHALLIVDKFSQLAQSCAQKSGNAPVS